MSFDETGTAVVGWRRLVDQRLTPFVGLSVGLLVLVLISMIWIGSNASADEVAAEEENEESLTDESSPDLPQADSSISELARSGGIGDATGALSDPRTKDEEEGADDEEGEGEEPNTETSELAPEVEPEPEPEPPTPEPVAETPPPEPPPTEPPPPEPPPTEPPAPEPPPTEPPAAEAPEPAPAGELPSGTDELVKCESGGNYQIVSANGLYHGAYQFGIPTWNGVAERTGRGDLVGVPPSQASPADQDAMFLQLYTERGKQPWPSCGRFLP